MEQTTGNVEAGIIRRRISFLRELANAAYVPPARRRHCEQAVRQCLIKLRNLELRR